MNASKRFEVRQENDEGFQYEGTYVNKSGNIFMNVVTRNTEMMTVFTWTGKTRQMYGYNIPTKDIQIVDDVEVVTFALRSGAKVTFRADMEVE